MDFFEAMSAMKEGSKVRMTTWPKDTYMGVEEESKKVFGKKVSVYKPITHHGLPVDSPISFVAFLKSQWEIFSEDPED